MAKKKKIKTNAIRILEQKKIPFIENEYPWSDEHIDAKSTAQTLGIPESSIYKTLVAIGNKTGVLVAVIPGDAEVDLKALAKVSGNKKVEMLPLKELEETTGYIRGGCSPIGMKKQFPTFIEKQALEKEEIHVSAGKRGLQIKVKASDLGEVVDGQFVSITQHRN